jgi:hypothetical protein
MAELKCFWLKCDGRVQELTWEQYKDLYMNEMKSKKIRRLLIRCEDGKYMIITHGRNVVTVPIQQLKQIIKSLGEKLDEV